MRVYPDCGAFPSPNQGNHWEGMSLRAYVAAKSLQGLLACPDVSGSSKEIAKIAVTFADDLIEELNK